MPDARRNPDNAQPDKTYKKTRHPCLTNSFSGKRSISVSKTQSLMKYQRWLQLAAIDGLSVVAEKTLNDDVFMLSVCTKVYRRLPLPIRRVVKCEWCLQYLQYSKPIILRRLQNLRAHTENSSALPKNASAEQQQPTSLP